MRPDPWRAPPLDGLSPAHAALVAAVRDQVERCPFDSLDALAAAMYKRPADSKRREGKRISEIARGSRFPDVNELKTLIVTCDGQAWPRVEPLFNAALAERVTPPHSPEISSLNGVRPRRTAILASLGVVALIATAVVAVIVTRSAYGSAPNPPTVTVGSLPSTSPPPATTAPPTTAAAFIDVGPRPTDDVQCNPFSDPAITIESIAQTSGSLRIGRENTVKIDVLRAAPPGHTYWLVTRLLTFQKPYIVKQKVATSAGKASYPLSFPNSSPGTPRDVYFMEGDAAETVGLEENYNLPPGQAGDDQRQSPPPGKIVSVTCRVTKSQP
jgi:hypothetical protein